MSYKEHKKGYRAAAYLLFGIYLVLMVYFLFFAESMGRNTSAQEYHYNLHPLREINRYIRHCHRLGMWPVMLNLAGNVVAFVPFGAFLPFLQRKCRSFFRVALYSFEVSLAVELIQLVYRVGSCDVDDVILNTLGGMLGYICFFTVRHHYQKGIRSR